MRLSHLQKPFHASRSWVISSALLMIALSYANSSAAEEAKAQSASESSATVQADSKSSLTGSLSLISDYRFRGISQTWQGAAVQGAVELALPKGFYVGTSLSNVSTNSYGRGQGLEHDIYGGWRGEIAPDWLLDAGLLQYRYPGARLGASDGSSKRFDTTELYLGATHGGLSLKWSVALTPYFGLGQSTADSAFATALQPAGSSRGSQYLDLNYQHPLGDLATLGLHGGYTWVRNYSDVSYADWRISLSRAWGPWTASLAYAGTSADARYYSAVNSRGQWRDLARSGWLLGLSAGF